MAPSGAGLGGASRAEMGSDRGPVGLRRPHPEVAASLSSVVLFREAGGPVWPRGIAGRPWPGSHRAAPGTGPEGAAQRERVCGQYPRAVGSPPALRLPPSSSRHYDIRRNDDIINFFNDFSDHLAEEALWELSLKIKPRNITRRKTDREEKT